MIIRTFKQMKIIRDSVLYLGGDLVSRSIPFILLPFLTRTLGVDGFGDLSYYQVIIALGLIFIGFSQDGALTRYYYKYGSHGLGSLIIVGCAQSIIICTVMIAVARVFWNNNLFIYSIMAAFTQAILSILFATQQCQRKAGWYVAIQLINAIFSAGITILLFIFFQADVLNRILAIFIANTVSLLIAITLVYYVQENKVRCSLPFFKSLFAYNISYGFPLILHQLSFFAKGQADRFLIYKMFSSSILGVYSVGYQLASIIAILLMALNKATVPYYYEFLKNKSFGKKEVLQYTKLSFIFTPFPFLCYLVVPDKCYIFLLGTGFEGAKYYTLIFSLAISLTIPYLLLVNYFFFHGNNKTISLCTISSSMLYIILVFVLARVDIKYVPYAMIMSNIMMILMLYIKLTKEYVR